MDDYKRVKLHEKLGKYFSKLPNSDMRKFVEYPFQLKSANNWGGLAKFMCSIEVFEFMIQELR
jgi:hypothetical protein